MQRNQSLFSLSWRLASVKIGIWHETQNFGLGMKTFLKRLLTFSTFSTLTCSWHSTELQLELETNVAEDYAKFYKKDPLQGVQGVGRKHYWKHYAKWALTHDISLIYDETLGPQLHWWQLNECCFTSPQKLFSMKLNIMRKLFLFKDTNQLPNFNTFY